MKRSASAGAFLGLLLLEHFHLRRCRADARAVSSKPSAEGPG